MNKSASCGGHAMQGDLIHVGVLSTAAQDLGRGRLSTGHPKAHVSHLKTINEKNLVQIPPVLLPTKSTSFHSLTITLRKLQKAVRWLD